MHKIEKRQALEANLKSGNGDAEPVCNEIRHEKLLLFTFVNLGPLL
jgi:hypothetical protein